jgi:signal transduction histidine kinase
LKDLAALSGELVRERTEERRDISRYIHDSISQHLVALSFTLSALPAVNADLPHLVELCCRDVRVISCIMTPPPHGEGNLFANIETYAGWLGRETGSPINVSGGGRLPPTTPDTEHLILAAVQEWMIQTILKRVKASSFITLSGEGSGILLELKSVPDPDTD